MDADKKRALVTRIKNEYLQNAKEEVTSTICAMDVEMWSLSDLRKVDEIHKSLQKMRDELITIQKFFENKLGNMK